VNWGNRKRRHALALGAVTTVAAFAPWQQARADESPFAYTYLTEVLPQGEIELEQWLTWKHKKPQEKFDVLEGRTEFEYGFTNRFLGALYLNYEHVNIEPEGPGAPNDAENTTKFTGVNAEFIYQVWSPFTAPFGFALYAEPSIGDGERALEFKLLFQKNFLEDRLIFATNFIFEFEWEHEEEEDEWEREAAFEINIGLAYRVAPGWFLGAELLNENSYEGHFDEAETSSWYVGPAVHYAAQNWWATLGFYKQLPWASNHTDEPELTSHGYVVDAERTRLRFRLGILL
jgi:hypothetical protein